MKRLLLSIIILLCIHLNAEAQTIRLGERMPDINVESEYGRSLEQIASNYVCLVFIHSESTTCMGATERLDAIFNAHSETIHTVLVTYEEPNEENSIRSRITLRNYSLAFDINQRTFRAFDIHYVPFGVIYDTQRYRVQWFGPIQQLNAQTINQIITH